MLEGRQKEFLSADSIGDDDGSDLDFEPETMDGAFFDHEKASLREILQRLACLPKDGKWSVCQELLVGLDREQEGCKVLFFTQFRATQDYLQEQLQSLFPGCGVEIVNGDVPLIERRLARKRFEGASRFMISTEAGGEGVNLQKACHLMVNYDLAWNPMRMQQRIGRLDRYGQKKPVAVFNLRVSSFTISSIFRSSTDEYEGCPRLSKDVFLASLLRTRLLLSSRSKTLTLN